LLGVLACLAVVGLALPAVVAADNGQGQNANSQGQGLTSVTSCGPILSSGKYRLDADITSFDTDCFPISANSVTFLLNGHTITSAAPISSFGIHVFGSGAIIVGPGTITGWGQAGIGLAADGESVRGVTVPGNQVGIRLFGASVGNSIRANVANQNAFGIALDPGSTGNTIIGNTALNNTSVDLFDANFNCDSNVWRGNDFDPGSTNQSCIH
jgi:parallel beta-helix repeat protein